MHIIIFRFFLLFLIYRQLLSPNIQQKHYLNNGYAMDGGRHVSKLAVIIFSKIKKKKLLLLLKLYESITCRESFNWKLFFFYDLNRCWYVVSVIICKSQNFSIFVQCFERWIYNWQTEMLIMAFQIMAIRTEE